MTDTNSHSPQSARDTIMRRAHARKCARDANRAEWAADQSRRMRELWANWRARKAAEKRAKPRTLAD